MRGDRITFSNRGDGSYYTWCVNPATGARLILGVVRKLAHERWLATPPGYPPPEAAEHSTRQAAALWLREFDGSA